MPPYGVATFPNGELISADEDDAFSYCAGDESYVFLFRSQTLQNAAFQAALAEQCAEGAVDATFCAYATLGVLPIQLLPLWHGSFPEENYDLGLAWDFPFLLRMEYQASVAGAVTADQDPGAGFSAGRI